MELAFTKLNEIIVDREDTLSDAVLCIEKSGSVACALIYDGKNFIDIFTDGDIRRALLFGLTLNDKISSALVVKDSSSHNLGPISIDLNSTYQERQELFEKHSLRQLILTDGANPVAVIDYKSINFQPRHLGGDFSALIMAGGFGTRLKPYTDETPKPMLPINGTPMLEISIKYLIKFGVKKIFISTHYLPHVIQDHFGDGALHGVSIEYIHEEIPSGTGGALALMPKNFDAQNLLVINGDILTKMDVEMFVAHHLRSQAIMTLAATQYGFEVPYGVLQTDGSKIVGLEEKPKYKFSVNSGIYLLSRDALQFLPSSSHFNMTDIANNLINAGKCVECFTMFEPWMDVGRPSDYIDAAKFF